MNIPSTLGALGTLLGLVRAVPQLVRLLRAREAFGVSVDTAGTSSIVSFGWVVYGLLTNQLFVCLATGCSGVIFAIITVAALRFGRRVNEFRITPAWCAVLLLAGMLGGKSGLGLVLPVSVLVANLPQLWVAYKECDLRDLSLGTWLLSISDGLVWGIYALLQKDVPIMVYGLFQFCTSGLIVGLKMARKRSGSGVSSFSRRCCSPAGISKTDRPR
jgi:uncharacterized protein with PQ loop repeat